MGDDFERRGFAVFEHGEQGGAFAVFAHDVGLRGVAHVDLGYILDVDHGAVGGAHGEVVERGDGGGAGVEFDDHLAVAHAGDAGGEDEVLLVHGRGDVGGGHVMGEEQIGVGVDHDLLDFAAVGQRDAGAFDGRETWAHEADAIVVEVGFTDAVAAEGKLHDGNGGRIELDDVRRKGAWRQDAQDGLHQRGHLRDGKLDLGVWLKEDADDRDALIAFAFQVLDVIDGGGEATFAGGDDTAFHLGRG